MDEGKVDRVVTYASGMVVRGDLVLFGTIKLAQMSIESVPGTVALAGRSTGSTPAKLQNVAYL